MKPIGAEKQRQKQRLDVRLSQISWSKGTHGEQILKIVRLGIPYALII
jgi:hypothetical protein